MLPASFKMNSRKRTRNGIAEQNVEIKNFIQVLIILPVLFYISLLGTASSPCQLAVSATAQKEKSVAQLFLFKM